MCDNRNQSGYRVNTSENHNTPDNTVGFRFIRLAEKCLDPSISTEFDPCKTRLLSCKVQMFPNPKTTAYNVHANGLKNNQPVCTSQGKTICRCCTPMTSNATECPCYYSNYVCPSFNPYYYDPNYSLMYDPSKLYQTPSAPQSNQPCVSGRRYRVKLYREPRPHHGGSNSGSSGSSGPRGKDGFTDDTDAEREHHFRHDALRRSSTDESQARNANSLTQDPVAPKENPK